MPALAKAGYYVVAPDLRGYGRTAVGPVAYEDVSPFLSMEPPTIVRLPRQSGSSALVVGLTRCP
jgi:pimeloyl-ACP methyl ester carboxylesterase